MSPAPPRQLKPAPWPASDREAWEALFAEGDVLAGAGPARHWAPATRKGNGWRYARWLGWLAAGGLLDPDLSPRARATPEAVRGCVEALRGEVAPKTVVSPTWPASRRCSGRCTPRRTGAG